MTLMDIAANGATNATSAMPDTGRPVDHTANNDAVDEESSTHHVFKILVTGPFAAGKTSLIQSVSQTPVVATDVLTSGDESGVKAETTVAMDFGTFTLEEGDVQLLMFGTPGQERFWFMTDILKGDVDVVVYVVDATANGSHSEAGAAMRELLRDLRVPLVVAVNRCDDQDDANALARSLGALSSEAVVPCQLIDPESGRDVVVEALLALLDTMEQSQGHRRPAPRVLMVAP